ncbi:MAG: NAD-dependent epimerase/dehydratase family protein [Candidatus Schekmanbacteria bacterium]|nr:NAD-dependent epimerase/dehydratase family protein [Candidatus Schekmanbacteria bacterium]
MILVTGSAGHIGKRLSERLINDGIDFIGIDYMCNPELPLYKCRKMDVRDRSIFDLIKENKVSSVIHMAFSTKPKMDAKTRYDIDINGSKNIAACAGKNGVKNIVFISSCRVYGNSAEKGGIYDKEGNYLNPGDDLYANDKIKAENIFIEAAAKYGFRLAILRLGAVCLPGGREGIGGMIKNTSENGRFIRLSGKNPPIPLVHINDVINASMNAVGKEGIFDVYAKDKMTLSEIFSEAAMLGGRKPFPITLPEKPAVAILWLLWKLGISPIPPLFVKMLGYDITRDIKKTVNVLGKPAYTVRQIIDDIVNG